MARTIGISFGPEEDYLTAYAATAPQASVTVVTSPAPPQGTYFLQVDSSTTANWNILGNPSFPLTYLWFCFRVVRFAGTLSVGNACIICYFGRDNTGALRRVYETSTTFKLQLYNAQDSTVKATTTNAFSNDTNLAIRVEQGTRVKLWVDGVLEIDVATGSWGTTNGGFQLRNDGLAAGQTFLLRGFRSSNSASESDRPGTLVEAARCDPMTGTPTDNGYTGSPDTTNKYANWDDIGTPDDATSINIGPAFNIEQTSLMTSPFTFTNAPDELLMFLRERGNVAGKNVSAWARFRYSGSVSEVAMANLSSTTWRNDTARFLAAPGGGALSQAVIDGMELGSRVVSTNQANLEVTWISSEVFGIDNDPPAAAPDRRRLLAQVV